MSQSYGLGTPRQRPDPHAVDEMIDADGRTVMQILQQVYNGVNSYLDENTGRIDKVVGRLVNSVNGHLKRNVQLLQPIGQALLDHVNGYLASNDAIIGAAASHPPVADYLRSVPTAVRYNSSTPVPPPDDPPTVANPVNSPAAPGFLTPGARTGILPAAPPPVPALLPPPVSATPTSYTIWFDCTTREWVAVPNYTRDGSWNGWRPPPPWSGGYGWTNPIEELPAYLARFGEDMFMKACPNYIPPV